MMGVAITQPPEAVLSFPVPQHETPEWRAGVRSRGARGVTPETELARSARARGLAPSRHRPRGRGNPHLPASPRRREVW